MILMRDIFFKDSKKQRSKSFLTLFFLNQSQWLKADSFCYNRDETCLCSILQLDIYSLALQFVTSMNLSLEST